MVGSSDVEERLRTELDVQDLKVQELAGCGTSFALYIVSESFAGKRLLERHKLVNLALAPLMPHIHALSIKKAKTPEEEQGAAEKQKPPSQQQAAAM
ncbi:hypothetical protein CHLNCDRAFT_141798 [Chlorella variabilis]|uniref:BolA-like protein n=1 Tax=Chlorella variabilis TaxID=554065 RepID=E1ZTM6_CHLVA|nr:hypothetical protein CHLNCDRAFT_141798 [Chlorella variabilis]EFN50866.1 hypothetical protein CHLNCDRAFT_141798 [Chlorella variabilis]|eukprot:XP_005842968.1 hypothetical protein CHLNCDRAFT_141798 [Chlorella variabilis]